MDIKANNSSEMKRKNRALIMRMIRAQQLSRADVARNAGLTRAAVTVIVESLIRDGIVVEGETVMSDVGRRPTMLRIAPSARYAFGVDISSGGTLVGLTDLEGKVVERREFLHGEETEDVVRRADELTGGIAEAILELAAKYGVSGKRNLGVGVSSPGPVDLAAGRILDPPHLSVWRNFPVAGELSRRLGMRVFLDKDANALALAEKNSRRDSDNFLFITADNGLGGGFVKNGKIYRGAGGFGCEIGHIGIIFDGGQCRCGNRGCAELYASMPSLMRYARENGIGVANWRDAVALAQEGDAGCVALVEREADMLAAMCVSAVNVLEPELIVLGGQLNADVQWFAPMLEKRIASRMITRRHHRVAVRGSKLSFDAGLSAAAGLAVENFFLHGEIEDENT